MAIEKNEPVRCGVRVWNIRYARKQVGAEERWGMQMAVYEKARRKDGLFIWQITTELGPFRVNRGGPDGVKDLEKCEAEGRATELPRVGTARHGGMAVEMSDLIDPAREAAWRLDGLPLSLAWKWATVKRKRLITALAREEGGKLIKVTGVGTVTRKQVSDLSSMLSLPTREVGHIPREDEQEIGQTLKNQKRAK